MTRPARQDAPQAATTEAVGDWRHGPRTFGLVVHFLPPKRRSVSDRSLTLSDVGVEVSGNLQSDLRTSSDNVAQGLCGPYG